MAGLSTHDSTHPHDISIRTLIIGLALVVANLYWITLTSVVWDTLIHNYMSLFTNAIFTLFFLTLGNSLLMRASPRAALSRAELLVIYSMVVLATTLCGAPHLGRFIPILTHPFWFASPENDWKGLFLGHIPEWFTVHDPDVVRQYFDGEVSFFSEEILRSWSVPILVWSAFMFVLWAVLLCMNSILRRQFEYERLTYPITQLPVDMALDTRRFFTNRFLWTGFTVAAVVELYNGLGFLYPSVPSITMRYINVGAYFHERPWNAIGTSLVFLSPFLIGLSFLMPLELSFSSWFFYLFGKLQLVLADTVGWRQLYLDEQADGAWIGLGLVAIWLGRRHFQAVLRQVFGRGHPLDDSKEPLPYRWAFWGMIAGIFCLVVFAYKAGIALWAFGLFFGLYALMAIALTKVRAGLGPAMHEVIGKDPLRAMVSGLGTRPFGARNLTKLSFLYWLNRENVAHPMPNQLEQFRIGERSGVSNRKLLFAMLLTLAIGIPLAFVMNFTVLHSQGASRSPGFVTGLGWETFNRLERWVQAPTTANPISLGAMGLGFGFTMFLTGMKMRFLWWPFHPIGYVLGTGAWGDMSFIWVPVMLSWAVKSVVLSFGGMRAYKKALPFFAGLILGDYITGCAWSLIGIFVGKPMYNIWLA